MMTGKERIARILNHQPTDRIGLFEVFWEETTRNWVRQGHIASSSETKDHFNHSDGLTRLIASSSEIEDHFNLDLRRCKALVMEADPLVGEKIISENGDEIRVRDGNGAILRRLKSSPSVRELSDFTVKDREGWLDHAKPLLEDSKLARSRINFDLYRDMRRQCSEKNVFFTCAVVGAFDLMNPLCGHENLLSGMALDPEWVSEMSDLYSCLTVDLLEELFAREGLPDGIWVWDDLGYKNGPFMSPSMYRELIMPAHKRLFAFARSKGLAIILHTDGFIEPILPLLIEAGINCLQPMEVKAGMDPVRIKRQYGDKIALIGGMDARALSSNDPAKVRAELNSKLPALMSNGGYVLQSDHSVPDDVKYETYKLFKEEGLALGTYK